MSLLSLTPLFGVSDSSPHCYLLRCGSYTILLDAGWTHAMDTAPFAAMQAALLDVDCVLLSHSSFRHCGCLPLLRRRFGLQCPVYATLPVARMGSMTLYDAYQQHVQRMRREGAAAVSSSSSPQSPLAASVDGDSEIFTPDDIDAVFDSMRLLKYSEEFPLPPKLSRGAGGGGDGSAASGADSGSGSGRLVISPHSSGHSVGGAVWRLVADGEVLLYAVDYNHSKERHLEGGVLEAFTRPALLVMDAATLSPQQQQGWTASAASSASAHHQPPSAAASSSSAAAEQRPPTRRQREQSLWQRISATVERGGTVLLPTDSSGRVLELLVLLHAQWEKNAAWLQSVPLVFASPHSHRVVDWASAQVEWLSEACQRQLNSGSSATAVNPFALPLLHRLQSFAQLQQLTRGLQSPSVILASSATLEPASISLQVLDAIASQPHSTVILTHDVEEGSVAHQLFCLHQQRQQQQQLASSSSPSAPLVLQLRRPMQQPLEGEELRAFLSAARQRQQQQRMEEQSSGTAAVDDAEHDDDDDDDEDTAPDSDRNAVPRLSLPSTLSAAAFPALLPSPNPTPAAAASAAAAGSPAISASASPSFYQFPSAEQRPRGVDAFGELQPAVLAQPSTDAAAPAAATAAAGSPPQQPRHAEAAAAAGSARLSRAAPPLSSSSSSSSPSSAAAVPCKCVWTASSLAVSCAVAVEDFRGLSDLRAWKNIVAHVRPRQLLLLHGRDDAKAAFKQFCIDKQITQQQQQQRSAPSAALQEGEEGGADAVSGSVSAAAAASASGGSASLPSAIFIPAALECVEVSAEQSFRVCLSPQLFSRLRFARVGEFEIAFADAVVAAQEQSAALAMGMPMLAPAARAAAAAPAAARHRRSRASVFLGSYRFAELRSVLSAAGIDSEFYSRGGLLLAAKGSVRIRRTSATSISLQGLLSEHFFRIRALLYAHFSSRA